MVEFNAEQQKYVDKLVGEARKEGREAGRAEVEEELSALKAVSEEREQELKTLREQHDAATQALENELAHRLEGLKVLGDVKAALDALPMDTLGKLSWLEEHGSVLLGSGNGDENEDKGPGSPRTPPKETKVDRSPRPRRRVKL